MTCANKAPKVEGRRLPMRSDGPTVSFPSSGIGLDLGVAVASCIGSRASIVVARSNAKKQVRYRGMGYRYPRCKPLEAGPSPEKPLPSPVSTGGSGNESDM